MDLISRVRSAVIGRDETVEGPFGPRRLIYADYTASGRALEFIEDFIRDHVLPLYANTHTESSGTGRQTTTFREGARAIIARCTGAGADHVVLFCGTGSTGAIDHLIRVLGLRTSERHPVELPAEQRPVVFVGPYEHHSNELPWRESVADVVTIREDLDGSIDTAHLQAALAAHADRPLRIGSFSAASNVTGVVSDVQSVTALLHTHDALALWDYAAAAPYLPVDVGDLDAAFISPHKFVGGPGTPGVLIARRNLFSNRVPTVPGGGTVWYVNPDEHRYVTSIEQREEGGTPDIVGSIRAGLVFALKDAVGCEAIRAAEDRFLRAAVERWSAHPAIEILGNPDHERLSIVSFVVRDPGRRGYLHHNFVVAVLNDLFGIQSRGGCSCAGPYGHRLLGIDLDTSHAFEREIGRGCEGIKPGWVRVNFNYFIDAEELAYLLEAVELVASFGHRLLDCYDFDPASGLWTYVGGHGAEPMRLDDVAFGPAGLTFPRRPRLRGSDTLTDQLQAARAVLHDPPAVTAPRRPQATDDFEALRWFPLPGEARSW